METKTEKTVENEALKYDRMAVSLANQVKDDFEEEILAPELCGVYFSKYDLIEIARSLGANLGMNERKRLYGEIFKYIDDKEDFKAFIDALTHKVDRDLAHYDHFEATYAYANSVTGPWRQKAEAFKTRLADLLEVL